MVSLQTSLVWLFTFIMMAILIWHQFKYGTKPRLKFNSLVLYVELKHQIHYWYKDTRNETDIAAVWKGLVLCVTMTPWLSHYCWCKVEIFPGISSASCPSLSPSVQGRLLPSSLLLRHSAGCLLWYSLHHSKRETGYERNKMEDLRQGYMIIAKISNSGPPLLKEDSITAVILLIIEHLI